MTPLDSLNPATQGINAPPLPAPGFVHRTLHDEWLLGSAERQLIRVDTGHYQIHCELRLRSTAQCLLVVFHGARDNGPETKPQLIYPPWGRQVDAHVLLISDPTAERPWPGPLPRASMYIGTLAEPLAPALNALIDKAALSLGIAPEHTVLYGSSSGGAAALLIGSQRPVARVFTSNAMADFDSLPRRLVNRALEGLDCNPEEVARSRRREPWRFDPCAAWRHGLAEGKDLRLVIGQSTGDQRTYATHFPQLCGAAGISGQKGGFSPDGRTLALLHHEPGHSDEPPARLVQAGLTVLTAPEPSLNTALLSKLTNGSYELTEQPQELRQYPPPRPLRPAEKQGVLLLAGPPIHATRVLRPVLMGNPAVWLGLGRYRSLVNNCVAMTESLFTPEELRRVEGDEASPNESARAPDPMPEDWQSVRWIGDTLLGLHRRYLPVLRELPQARVIYLAADATTTLHSIQSVQEQTLADTALIREHLITALDEWRNQVRQTADALGRHGDRFFVISLAQLLESGEAAIQPLLAWLSLESTPGFLSQLKNYLKRFRTPIATQHPLDESLLERLTPNDHAAWQCILEHSRRALPLDRSAQAPR